MATHQTIFFSFLIPKLKLKLKIRLQLYLMIHCLIQDKVNLEKNSFIFVEFYV